MKFKIKEKCIKNLGDHIILSLLQGSPAVLHTVLVKEFVLLVKNNADFLELERKSGS